MTNNNNNAGSFEAFLEGWIVRQEHNFDELLTAQQNLHESSDEYLVELTSRVLSNYQQYYQEKSREANRNVFRVFCPPWLTPFERTFLWIAGFKPGLAFRLVESSVSTELSKNQSQRMKQLTDETKLEERHLEDRMVEIQVSAAAPPLYQLARQAAGGGRIRDGEIEGLRSALEAVVVRADWLRMTTAERVIEILSPAQNVKFVAAATQLQLKIRNVGLEKEAERAASNGW